ncbi:MAG: hypothetical protein JW944_13325 [Deltaproteobacteria bacterium]|nr:hypothetical protein [Deltaproteobacteria bacterium]
MKIFSDNIGRRRFISLSSMALGAGIIANQSDLVFAAEGSHQGGPSQGQGGTSPGGGGTASAQAKDDGTKYGKYIVLSQKSGPNERGSIPVVATLGNAIPGCDSMALIGRMPAKGSMTGHDSWERHDAPEYLIHLGNDPDDPMDLGADAEIYLGKGRWRERYAFNKTTAVYLPAGLPHCPWHVSNIRKNMTFVNLMVGRTWWGDNDQSTEVLSKEELAKAKISGYIFDKYMLSGVGKDVKDPKGGKMLACTDSTKIASAPLTRIIRYNPEGAPYSIFDTQTHEYATFIIFLGMDEDDASVLGADVELCMGEEKERHAFNKSALVWVPPNLKHGPLKVTKATKPFNFLEVVLGPELPA